MAQTRDGAAKIAAKRIGIELVDYLSRVESGEKWCFRCRAWHPLSAFGVEKARPDGLTPACRESRTKAAQLAYSPKPHPKGRSFVPARDGDRRQARRRINYFVSAGLLPAPNAIPCVDCGHCWKEGEKRHEYDHHLGYDAEHHEHVQAVCSTCHHKREASRR